MTVTEAPTPAALSIESSQVAIHAPGGGDGYWAGGPSAVLVDGEFSLAYRLRRPVDAGRGFANVVARSADGLHFETVATVLSDDLGCASLERPSLVHKPDGGWRLYLSLSTWGSKHWQIVALDSPDLEGLAAAQPVSVWPGDEGEAVKDPVVTVIDGVWHAWVCCHPLDTAGAEDRMWTRHATSADGLAWTWAGDVLEPAAGQWDGRGARIATVVPGFAPGDDHPDLALYDGRATAEENWYERTGLAIGDLQHGFTRVGAQPWAESSTGRPTLRYASGVSLPDGDVRFYFEAANASGSNDLRTQVIGGDELRILSRAAAH